MSSTIITSVSALLPVLWNYNLPPPCVSIGLAPSMSALAGVVHIISRRIEDPRSGAAESLQANAYHVGYVAVLVIHNQYP